MFRNIVILCFKRRFSKENSVILLKSNNLAPQKIFAPQISELATPLLSLPAQLTMELLHACLQQTNSSKHINCQKKTYEKLFFLFGANTQNKELPARNLRKQTRQ